MTDVLEYLSAERRGQHALDQLDMLDLQMADDLAGIDAARQAVEPEEESYPPAGRLFQDTQLALYKGAPRLRQRDEVRPSHRLNHAIMEELLEERRFRELRLQTRLDKTMSVLGAVNLWEQLVELLTEEQRKAAQRASEQEEQAHRQEAQARILQAMAASAAQKGDDARSQQVDAQAQELMRNAQANRQRAEAAMEQAADEVPSAREIRRALKRAADKTAEDAEALRGWGLAPGALQRVPPEERLALAERVRASQKLRSLAQMVGRFRNLVIAAQAEKTESAPGQVRGIELGDDVSRMLSSELTLFHHPALRRDLYRRLAEHQAMQYRMTGKRKLALGPLVVCYDESGSMTTMKELWAKAVVLAMLFIARRQQRPFSGIAFGSAHEIRVKTIRRPKTATMADVLEVAEPFFGGGTDFESPLTRAREIIEQAMDFTRADIVFITDGIASVSDGFLQDFQTFKKRTGTRVFTVLVDVGSSSEASVRAWSDQVHRVVDLAQDAQAAQQAAREVFGAV